MKIEDMFEFINPTAIRIKGTRVGIEIVIEHFLAGADPREIQRLYPNLTLEQIYVTITYYLLNKRKLTPILQRASNMQRLLMKSR